MVIGRALLIVLAYSLVLGQAVPAFALGDRPVMISADYILIPALVCVALVLPRNRFQLNASYKVWYSCFTLIAALSLAASILRLGIAPHYNSIIELVKWILYSAGIMTPAARIITSPRQAASLIKHMSIAAILSLAVGYWQLINTSAGEQRNIVGSFAILSLDEFVNVRNSYAVYLGGFAIALIAAWLTKPRWVLVICAVLTVLLMMFVMSRSGLLCLTVGVLWVLLAFFRFAQLSSQRIGRVLLSIVCGLAVFGGVLWFAQQRASSDPARPFAYTPVGAILVLGTLFDSNSGLALQNGTVLERAQILQRAALILGERPLLGCGYRSSGLYYPDLAIFDNYYAATLIQTGVLGLTCTLALIGSLLRFAWRLARRGAISGKDGGTSVGFAAACGGCILGMVVASVSASFPEVGRLTGTLVLLLCCCEAQVAGREPTREARQLATSPLDNVVRNLNAVSGHQSPSGSMSQS